MKVRNSEVCRRQYPALLQRAHSAGAILKISYNCCSLSVLYMALTLTAYSLEYPPTHFSFRLLAAVLHDRLIRLPVLTDKHVQFYNYFQLSTTNSKHYGSKRCELSISLPALHNLMHSSLERTRKHNTNNIPTIIRA